MSQRRPIEKEVPSEPISFCDEVVSLIPYLRAFARSLCRDRHEAEDLTQETLTRAWQARRSYEPGTNMRAWLFRILRNSYYSNCRRTRRQSPWSEQTAERLLVSDGAQRASMDLIDLQRAMATLSDEQREALILVGAGGVAYDEAAQICGCAVGTIKSRVARARRAILAALDGSGTSLPARTFGGEEATREICEHLDSLIGTGDRAGRPLKPQ